MKFADDGPSIWNLHAGLLSSRDFAEEFSRAEPRHSAAVSRFSQEVQRIKNELMRSFEASFASPSLYDVANGLTIARAIASILAERHPEMSGQLTKFVEDLGHAQQEFFQSVRSDTKQGG